MQKILVIGGGAAGYFAAITAAELSGAPFAASPSVVLAEAGRRTLQKVAISGGGRCNVTQGCFDVAQLLEGYPRGKKELRGPFSRFQPRDTVQWFESRGVALKTEDDGRMFPRTDSSSSIINCLEAARKNAAVDLRLSNKVTGLSAHKDGGFTATMRNADKVYDESFTAVVLATGSAKMGYQIAESLGHRIVACVPSLFTFEIQDERLHALAGLSVADAEVRLHIPGKAKRVERGPVLITHWGVSGPGIIKLSAWGARALHEQHYKAPLHINWCPQLSVDALGTCLSSYKEAHPKQIVQKNPAITLPKRLWERLCAAAGVQDTLRYAELSRRAETALVEQLTSGVYQICGKGVFKEEFVTCGGIALKEVDFKTMQSKLVPGLFFAGEILDIDGITGGYNFQNAWTTGYLAGASLSLGTANRSI